MLQPSCAAQLALWTRGWTGTLELLLQDELSNVLLVTLHVVLLHVSPLFMGSLKYEGNKP